MAQAYGVAKPGASWPSRWTFYIGKGGKVLAVDRSVSPRTAGADIAAKLAELGVSKREGS